MRPKTVLSILSAFLLVFQLVVGSHADACHGDAAAAQETAVCHAHAHDGTAGTEAPDHCDFHCIQHCGFLVEGAFELPVLFLGSEQVFSYLMRAPAPALAAPFRPPIV